MTMVEDIKTLSEVESNDFWLNAKIQLFINQIRMKDARILDVGCGTGLLTLKLLLKGHSVDSIDISEFSVETTKKKMRDVTGFGDRSNVWLSTIESLEFKEKYDYIILSDILEHIKEDTKTLNKSFELLKKGGHLLISVPAIKILYGKHDVYCEHIRRYSRKEIYEKVSDSNFNIVLIRYWNLLMIPTAFIFSKILKKCYPHGGVNSNRLLNKILEWYFINFENRVIMPLGLSLFIVAKKK